MAKRVAFLVDGFNVYYSLRDVEKLSKAKVKWLDLRKLLSDHLQRAQFPRTIPLADGVILEKPGSW